MEVPMSDYCTSIELDLMGLDCPFKAEVEFVHHPAIRGSYYEPGEAAWIEVTRVQIFETVPTPDGKHSYAERECPAWLHEWIASHDHTIDQCQEAIGSDFDDRADYEYERMRDREGV
jgi:hypothetical protein